MQKWALKEVCQQTAYQNNQCLFSREKRWWGEEAEEKKANTMELLLFVHITLTSVFTVG